MEKEGENKVKNKIGWCDMTLNPVWGCNNHCEYCYARGIAKRFARVIAFNNSNLSEFQFNFIYHGLKHFEPTWLESNFNKKFPKKPQRIFVGSMSEIYYWEKEWIDMVIKKIKQYPQHTFQFLTKHMEVYAKWVWPKNCILGVTITKQKDFDKQRGGYYYFNGNNKTFFSFEPLLEQINIEHFDMRYFKNHNVDWVIIGAETGNRKGKVTPRKQWIWDIVNYCQTNNIPIYVKDSIGKLYSQFGGIKEFPEEKR